MIKQKTAMTVMSVIVVLALAIGGTLAYLTAESEEVENKFQKNTVDVDLTETGAVYNIIPGFTQSKNPTVTVDITVPSYVFVEVEDDTGGLVSWDIADGWTLLPGTEYVYYREASPTYATGTGEDGNPTLDVSNTRQEFPVLKDNQVIYAASLTNTDMENADETPTLSFTSYVVQKYKSGVVNADGTIPSSATAFTVGEAWTLVNSDDKETTAVNTDSETYDPDTGTTLNTTYGSVSIPSGVEYTITDDDDEPVILQDGETVVYTEELTVEPIENGNITISDGNSAVSYEVGLDTIAVVTHTDGTTTEYTNVTAPTGTVYTVNLYIGVVDLQSFYHNGTAMTEDIDGTLADGEYTYNSSTGYVTFATSSFSPFTAVYLFAGGLGTSAYPYLIDDASKMQAITNLYDTGYSYYKWNGASTLDCSNWTAVDINGSFDGNGVTFNNLDARLFGYVGTSSIDNSNIYTIEDFTVNAAINISGYGAAVIHSAGNNLTIKDVTVHGTIEGNNGAASFVCFGPGNLADSDDKIQPMQWSFINCISDANIIATGDMAVGFIKHPYCWASQKGGVAEAQDACLITIVDSIFNGTLTATSANAKYFVGNANDMLVKTSYSSDFVSKYGNPEGVSYATPTAKTTDGIFFIGNYPGEGTKISAYSNYGTCKDTYLGSMSSVSVVAGTNPEKYSVFTVNQNSNAVTAKAVLEIAPNDTNGKGAYLGTYMSEDITLTSGSATFTTSTIKYFDITINGNATGSTGLSDDGKTFNVVNSFYGTTYASATVRVIQYDSSGNVVNVTSFSITD